MPYQPIAGIHVRGERELPKDEHPCARCGRLRKITGQTKRPLCQDCKYVMSPEEIKMWMEAA